MKYARRSRLGVSLAAGLWICALVTALQVDAAPLDSVPSMDAVRSRLELTPQQEAQLRPLFEQRVADLQQTRASLEQAASKADKRAIMQEAKKKQQAFNKSVESVLTPSQKPRWHELRNETREKLRQRAEDKRELELH